MHFVQEHIQIWDKALHKTLSEQEQLVQIPDVHLMLPFYYTHSFHAQTIKQQTSSCVSKKLVSVYIKSALNHSHSYIACRKVNLINC
jgi:hypothetical protein